jgi:hypothetical protein
MSEADLRLPIAVLPCLLLPVIPGSMAAHPPFLAEKILDQAIHDELCMD